MGVVTGPSTGASAVVPLPLSPKIERGGKRVEKKE